MIASRIFKSARLQLALLLTLACASPPASAATITVLTAGAFKPVLMAPKGDFESAGGHSLLVDNDTAGALVKRIAGGERFDLVILPPSALEALAKSGRIAAGPSVEVARVGIGVAVAAGAAKPDISTVPAFRQALLDARKVAFIDPASGGSSGPYLIRLFEQLGIGEEMKAKSVPVPGGLVANRLLSGEADLALHQISEILAVKGVVLVGPLPAEIQNETVYAAAIAADTQHRAAAQALIGALTGPKAAKVLLEMGMLPPRP